MEYLSRYLGEIIQNKWVIGDRFYTSNIVIVEAILSRSMRFRKSKI